MHLKLRNLRMQKGLTQDELGSALGLSKQALSGYERGRRTPDLYTLIRLADFFEVSLDELVGHYRKKCSYDSILTRLFQRQDVLRLSEELLLCDERLVTTLHQLIKFINGERGQPHTASAADSTSETNQ